MRKTLVALLLVSLAACSTTGGPSEDAAPDPAAPAAEGDEPERTKHPILLYLPNRLFDFMDVVRARVRVGPGIAVQARATRPVSVALGGYSSLFVGLPGPRGRPEVPWPVGIENYAGIEVSVVGAHTERWGPSYGPTEVGAGAQLAVVGVDIGLEPLELIDLLLGFVFLDIRDDDY